MVFDLFPSSIKKQNQKGFTLVEIIIASALFAMIGVGVYQAYASLIALVSAARVKIVATDLLNEQFELIRNLSYDKVGIQGGIPSGVLTATSTYPRDNATFTITRVIRNIDDTFDGVIGGSPNDLSPADYKMVDLEISCATCKNFQPMSVVTRVAPKNLETASTNGALFIRVFDANGQPIQGANVNVVNNKATTTITINDVTDAQGMLQIVDAPPGVNAYQITVTKSGYTTDQTYSTSTGNPNPTKPHATVLLQQVTQISFVIDQVSTVKVATLSDTCSAIGSIPFSIQGTKLIGASPDVYKYSQSFTTNSGGNKTISNVEWDTYNLSVTSGGYRLAGVNPLLPVAVLPNATQNIDLILTTQPLSILLVTVKDSATQLPLSSASVNITGNSLNQTLTTGQGFMRQTDWSGGPGQLDFVNQSQYLSSDGNVDTNNPTGEIKLNNIFGSYISNGNINSSTFDTGTTTNFNQISWAPIAQPPDTGSGSAAFQIATASTNDASTTWSFLGPDGTNATFYDTSNTNIHSVHDGDRYLRYKGFLSTASTTFTPLVSDVAFTFTSACTPPGQVFFHSLGGGTYTITVDKTGYGQYQGQVVIPNDNSWMQHEVILIPN